MTVKAYSGTRGRSVLYEFWQGPMSQAEAERIEAQLDAILKHIRAGSPDRLLALLAGLVVENGLKAVLEAFLPRFKVVSDRDFTFSMKVQLLQGLSLIPSHIPSNADFIRSIRNDFAHNLDFANLQDLPTDRQQALRDRYRKLGLKAAGISPTEQLRDLAYRTAAGLHGYAHAAAYVRRFMHTRDFEAALFKHFEGEFDV